MNNDNTHKLEAHLGLTTEKLKGNVKLCKEEQECDVNVRLVKEGMKGDEAEEVGLESLDFHSLLAGNDEVMRMTRHWILNILHTFIYVFICTWPILFHQIQESTQLIIKSINVPPLVKAGEVDYVILDCDYDLQNVSSDGLVVKWYFNNDNVEYQWIYGHEPRADPSASHIDVGYKASDDPYTMYRAMKLNNPTINLTGDYSCAVFTYYDEEIAEASMIVYSTEEKFDLEHRKKIINGKEGMEVTCLAEGLYPQPTMDITVNDVPLNQTEKPDLIMREDGKYDIILQVAMKDEDLPNDEEILVKCNLNIPRANYTRELVYYAGGIAPNFTVNFALIVVTFFTLSLIH
ncbi:uncharacterized protein [Chelonus insularis]|uniref:uncharacterized protein isoform X2 n=1 Tax=Chelonus insularis TaxID=460826 RepID=UPI001588EFC3|nr:uncharacterized protein LOC118064639 isoform X2 [Chelonus insularis]